MQWAGILLSLPWMALCFFLLALWARREGLETSTRKFVYGAFGIKLLATFALQALYTYYYSDRSTADIYRFFDDGLILNKIAYSNPSDFFRIMIGHYPDEKFRHVYFDQMNAWIKPFDSGFYNDNHTMIRYNALLAFISFGYYEVHAVLTSFLSFSGILMIGLSVLRKRLEWMLLICSVIPGILLWTSGVLKESLVVFGMGLLFSSALQSVWDTWKYGSRFLIGSLVLILVKPYFLASFIPAWIAWRSMRVIVKNSSHRSLWQWGAWLLLFFLGIAASFGLGVDLLAEISQKQNDFLNHASEINAGSLVEMDRLDGSLGSFFKIAPQALVNSLLRPYPWELSGFTGLLLLIENLLLWCLVVFAALTGKKPAGRTGVQSFLIQFILPVLMLIGFTTPVLGAIMRYRAPLLVVAIVFLFQYLPHDRFKLPFSHK